ncbi:3'-5' exonuclease [Jeotgalibacillus sp. S-D1]|uniref:3'-5' exonuclease n=1 Tax=Jeotgalibacillus sp. S-D1 TaxID=2552189 RepID=UPI001404DC18|nr:3'-5' exonuclease [Jeotgalibacillus sp. S-D1]
MKFAAIDFETANSSRNSVCSVGVVKVDDGVITEEFYSLINPLQNFDSRNIAVHGIYPQDVENAPTFSEYWPELESQLSGNIIIAHNASFDMSVLRASLDRMGEPYPQLTYSCTYMIAKKVYPGLPSYRLSKLSALLNIPLNHHHALDDARAAAKIMMDACRQHGLSTLNEVQAKIGVRDGRLYPGGYQPASGAKSSKNPNRNYVKTGPFGARK